MTKSSSPPWLGAFLLLCLLPPAAPRACPSQCETGFVLRDCKCVPCNHGQYWYIRSGEGRCEKCIPSCSDKENKVEVKACTVTTRRECHCKPGFFCPSPTEINCRRECEPCEAGTFSSTASLKGKCQPYTDCASEGMVLLREGSSTEDRVCIPPPTTPIPTPTNEPMNTPTSISTPAPTITPTPTSTPMTTSKSVTVPFTMIFAPKTDAPSTVTPAVATTSHQSTNGLKQQTLKSTHQLRTTGYMKHFHSEITITSSTSTDNKSNADEREGPLPPSLNWLFYSAADRLPLAGADLSLHEVQRQYLKEQTVLARSHNREISAAFAEATASSVFLSQQLP
ncbi:tumor necrosis factor receptor superfamily member 21 isoform X2 [Colossoma macropomum]|uniref:tumor necrosis factor receptor superfamily member 21 isoform X2 n=1 Tax=Colossoma macropomum TaxID=42526 RepID=UPI001863E5EE|nr:tumor necrosis factor receptor superfamily member 21 isoform X2 [Colossoma macropomum]